MGRHSDPASLHKYLYTHGNPINANDPGGQLSVSDTLVTAFNMLRLVVRHAPKVYRAYQFYTRVENAIQVLGAVRDVYYAVSDGWDEDDAQLIGGYVYQLSIDILFDALVGRALKALGPAAGRLAERVAEKMAKNVASHPMTRDTIEANAPMVSGE